LLGEHKRTLPNTTENLFTALKLKKGGASIRMTQTEIHVYKSLSSTEGQRLIDLVNKRKRKK